ncbi:MAG: 30S ribosomal protein S16 [Proteobacteria bacterium]|nr:30S ribosomal protein S16 [Pseudomonadota bacterium]
MAVRIRLKRMGKKKQPYYRVVVADVRSPRDGRFIENIGTYDPGEDPAAVTIEEEKALYWLSQGAAPSDTVRSLFSKAGILKKFDEKRGSTSNS